MIGLEDTLGRTLFDAERTANNNQFTFMDFDEHVGDHGSFPTDWIESVLEKGGVPGYDYTADGQTAAQPTHTATGGAVA